MKLIKILTRVQYLKEYFKALIKNDYMQFEVLKKSSVFSKYFIFLRCEKCSILPIIITEKEVTGNCHLFLLVKENHQQCWWFQKALAMSRKNILL